MHFDFIILPSLENFQWFLKVRRVEDFIALNIVLGSLYHDYTSSYVYLILVNFLHCVLVLLHLIFNPWIFHFQTCKFASQVLLF
jgi:hypothetical protein